MANSGKLGYGMQILFDGYGASKGLLDDTAKIYALLDELPEKIGMHKLSPPSVLYYDGGEKVEDRGITGFVIIAESHISLHGYSEKGFVTVDVYSCKEFDAEAVVKVLVKTFEVQDYEKQVIKRGSKFQRS